MSTPSKHKLLVILDGTLQSMAGNTQLTAEFPFLADLNKHRETTGCGSCGGNKIKAGAFQNAKRAIAGLSPERKRRLKSLLNAEKLRVLFKSDAGQVVQLTF